MRLTNELYSLEGQCKNKEQIKKLPETILFDLFQGIVHGCF